MAIAIAQSHAQIHSPKVVQAVDAVQHALQQQVGCICRHGLRRIQAGCYPPHLASGQHRLPSSRMHLSIRHPHGSGQGVIQALGSSCSQLVVAYTLIQAGASQQLLQQLFRLTCSHYCRLLLLLLLLLLRLALWLLDCMCVNMT
jgi:hypothetical protein